MPLQQFCKVKSIDLRWKQPSYIDHSKITLARDRSMNEILTEKKSTNNLLSLANQGDLPDQFYLKLESFMKISQGKYKKVSETKSYLIFNSKKLLLANKRRKRKLANSKKLARKLKGRSNRGKPSLKALSSFRFAQVDLTNTANNTNYTVFSEVIYGGWAEYTHSLSQSLFLDVKIGGEMLSWQDPNDRVLQGDSSNSLFRSQVGLQYKFAKLKLFGSAEYGQFEHVFTDDNTTIKIATATTYSLSTGISFEFYRSQNWNLGTSLIARYVPAKKVDFLNTKAHNLYSGSVFSDIKMTSDWDFIMDGKISKKLVESDSIDQDHTNLILTLGVKRSF